MNRKQTQALVASLLMLFILTGCGLIGNPASATQDSGVFFTQAAQTMSADMTLVALGNYTGQDNFTDTPEPSNTPMPLPTEEPPTITPPVIDTIAPPAATDTPEPPPAPDAPMLSVSENTNCRAGPSPIYGVEGYITTDMSLPVTGINEGRSWWWVENPTYPGYHCWVWKYTANVEGDISQVPVYRDPWTPTPGMADISTDIYAWTGNVKGKCPQQVNFSAIIRSDRAVHVRYQWLKKSGAIGDQGWVTIAADGSAVLGYSFNASTSTDSWVKLQILYPTRITSQRARFTVKCEK